MQVFDTFFCSKLYFFNIQLPLLNNRSLFLLKNLHNSNIFLNFAAVFGLKNVHFSAGILKNEHFY